MNRIRATLAVGAVGVLITAVVTVAFPQAAAVAATCSPNPVVCENQLAGTSPSVWQIDGVGDETIQGFATDMSVNAGQTVGFKVRAEAAFKIDIYRLGYYGGNGARKITSLPGTYPAQNQTTECVTDPNTQIYDCGTWNTAATWTAPATAVSGVYFALLTRPDDGGTSHITFVVREDARNSEVFFKTSDATWQAYNKYGGADFYGGPNGRATKLSYNRPFATRGVLAGRDFLFSNEYPAIRFLERNGYDVTYTTDVDGDRNAALVSNHEIFLSVGHDEYWSGPQRAAVEAARDTGTNLAFLSGNEVYWRTRWEPSKDGNNTAHRTIVCYKETWANQKSDPTNEWTGTWRDPRYAEPAQGAGRPENALTGTAFMANSDDLDLSVPAAQGKNRFWRGTTVATQSAGSTMLLAPHTIGYESDEDLDNGFRPAGLIRLSTTVGETPEYLRDFGNTVSAGETTHHMTLYRAPSGALVFGAGTVQYAWGLDANHDSAFDPIAPADSRMQQAIVNLFADMHVQPATRMSGLAAASASTDSTGPTTTITSPASGASVANGANVTITGSAADSGGVVAGIEVSLDNGNTWHPATGTTSWTYSGHVGGDGTASIRVRATDDSANIGPVATRSVTVTGSASLFGSRVPDTPATSDADAAELGVRVTPQTDGFIKGIRFYKGTGNTGTHNGTLWSADGDQLAGGTFVNETASGWQTLTFSPAVPVVAGTIYVASYTAPNGRYAADPWTFAYQAHHSPPLSSPRSTQTYGNGVYGNPGSFPVRSYNSANYYVDVLFDSSALTPPTVSTVTPTPNAIYVPVSAHPTATFSKPINPATIQFTLTGPGGAAVSGALDYDAASRTATFAPSALAAGQQYTATVTASDTNGNPLPAPQTWSFTTDPGATTVNTLFTAADNPATTAVKESAAISVGMKFTPSADGVVIGVRFYKGAGNGGTHKGSLWTAAGARLATATFVSESAGGWQTVYFAEPVEVNGGVQYVASYYAPRGNYAATSGYFSTARTNGPLSAPAGQNGVYVYGSDAFPVTSWSSTNYWVDPLFVASPPPPQPEVPAGATTVFPATATPVNASWNDPGNLEVGLKFTSDVAGQVNGVRFYKGAGNSGAHSGTLWTASGALLASGPFVGETASGWQTMLFTSPVTITPNTQYVVSYLAPNGRYAVDVNGLSAPVVNAPLRTVAGGGSYKYGGGFPGSAVNHNYWVDVIFTPVS
ncbi:DUF4082 domain-containing protein [Actinoplanes sp. TRM 88003]|uniref:DUF4082 domain-containing protein n=1 Tax=Paractinoplanes aksuensis TaxID=2939490 RepID=A0ABT1DLR4_9ACTN|nr:DUF4082 domain-containing protein [Actinoplanes aksuensis]MCO8271754.1 DUF4082 domain-containing protein [Actinoplanes aksuensis]